MKIIAPFEFEKHTFENQLNWIETWARLPKNTITPIANELIDAHNNSFTGMLPILKNHISTSWSWPEYKAFVNAGGLQFKDDMFIDMLDKIQRKILTRRSLIQHTNQIIDVMFFRPYLQLITCGSKNIKTIEDYKSFLLSEASPIECRHIDCDCSIFSLSNFEYKQMAL